jgi:serine phosphatase RsbU (regulator of sigma subunit)/pSer/pThr/pTyr-binding forkhead associated (FHA) protein
VRAKTPAKPSDIAVADAASRVIPPVTEPPVDPSLLSSPLQVTWIDSHGERTTLELEEPELLIGRSHRCRLRDPSDPVISRQHARLVCTDGVWHVVDCGSRNRTYRNSHQVIAPEAIAPGDTISVGHCRVIVGPHGAGGAVEISEPSSTEHTIRTLDVSGERSSGTMRVLVEAARRIASQEPASQVIESLLALALHSTGAERGLVALHREDGTLSPLAWKGPDPEGMPRPSRSVVSRVLQEGKAVAIHDAQLDSGGRPGDSLTDGTIRSVLCAPFGPGRPAAGVLYLDRRQGTAMFDDPHLQVVAVLAGMMHVAQANQEARAQERRLKALEGELAAAARVQDMLLPPADLAPPPGFRVAAWHDPCQAIGGDIYDFFRVGRGFGVMLADVSGKGLAAALLVAGLHARWHAITQLQIPSERMLSQLNEEVSYRMPTNRFITLAAAHADPLRDELIFASAGHGPAILLHERDVELLEPTGPPLGVMQDAPYDCLRRPFFPGESLVLLSDGVFDQCDAQGEPLGMERVAACAREAAAGDAQAIVRAIVHGLEKHAGNAEQDDDTTIAVLARV